MAKRKMQAAVDMANRRAKKLSAERRSEIASQGALARHEKLTPEQRSAIARKAGQAGGRGRKKKAN